MIDYTKLANQKINHQQAIDLVLENYDFAKVQSCMKALNWTWRGAPSSPSIQELKTQAKLLLEYAYNRACDSWNKKQGKKKIQFTTATGGLEATCFKYKDGEIVFELKFIVSSFNYSTQDTCY